MARLKLEGVHFRDRGPIDLQVDAGECVTLTGASGSGKTLLLRAIADLDPHEGRISAGETDCQAMLAPEWRRQVGLLFSDGAWWRDRVGEHFGDLPEDRLEAVGFDAGVLDWSVSRCSTGERQRLAVLRLLANRPEVLLVDEPTANLDGENARRVETLLASYREQTGAAVLWVTHDAAQARRVGSRHFILDAGRLVEAPS